MGRTPGYAPRLEWAGGRKCPGAPQARASWNGLLQAAASGPHHHVAGGEPSLGSSLLPTGFSLLAPVKPWSGVCPRSHSAFGETRWLGVWAHVSGAALGPAFPGRDKEKSGGAAPSLSQHSQSVL